MHADEKIIFIKFLSYQNKNNIWESYLSCENYFLIEPQRRREASALGGLPDLKQLARHREKNQLLAHEQTLRLKLSLIAPKYLPRL